MDYTLAGKDTTLSGILGYRVEVVQSPFNADFDKYDLYPSTKSIWIDFLVNVKGVKALLIRISFFLEDDLVFLVALPFSSKYA